MKNIENDKYIINEDYHGDVKVIKNNSKKVDLSKPTDTLEHKSKQQEFMPTIYSNNNPPRIVKNQSKVCLTKPKDIITKEEKSMKAEMLFETILAEEQSKKQQKKINIPLIMATVLVSLIPIVAYVLNNGLDFYDTIELLIVPTILICKLVNNKK